LVGAVLSLCVSASSHANNGIISLLTSPGESEIAHCLAVSNTSPYDPRRIPNPLRVNQIPLAITPSEGTFNMGYFIGGVDGLDDDNGDGEPDVTGLATWVAYKAPERADLKDVNPPAAPDQLYEHWGINRLLSYERPFTIKLREVYDRNPSYRPISLVPQKHIAAFDREQSCNVYFAFLQAPSNSEWQRYLWNTSNRFIESLGNQDSDVYVISGPVFDKTINYIEGDGLEKIAIPEGVFRVIVKLQHGTASVLSLYFPNNKGVNSRRPLTQEHCGKDFQGILSHYIVKLEAIEKRSGLSFRSNFVKDNKQFTEDPKAFFIGREKGGCF